MIKYFEPVLDNILKDVDVLNKNILIEEKDIQKIKMVQTLFYPTYLMVIMNPIYF